MPTISELIAEEQRALQGTQDAPTGPAPAAPGSIGSLIAQEQERLGQPPTQALLPAISYPPPAVNPEDDDGPGLLPSVLRSLGAGGLQFAGGALTGVGELFETGQRTTESLRDFILPDAAEEAFKKIPGREALDWSPGPFIQEVGRALKEEGREVGLPESKKALPYKVLEGLGQMAGQVSTILLNPAAGTLALFAQGLDQQEDMMRAAGVDPDTFSNDAVKMAGGVVTALSERTGLDLLMNRVPAQVKGRVLKYLTDITIAGGIEAAEEFIEGVAHNTLAQLNYNPDQEILEGWKENMEVGGATGGVARLIVNAIVPGRGVSKLKNASPADYFTPLEEQLAQMKQDRDAFKEQAERVAQETAIAPPSSLDIPLSDEARPLATNPQSQLAKEESTRLANFYEVQIGDKKQALADVDLTKHRGTTVVGQVGDTVAKLIEEKEIEINYLRSVVDQVELQIEEGFNPPFAESVEHEARKESLIGLEDQLNNLRVTEQKTVGLFQEMADMVSQYAAIYMPDTTMVVDEGLMHFYLNRFAENAEDAATVASSIQHNRGGAWFDAERNIGYISVNPIMEDAVREDGSFNERKFYHNLSHEFGHSMVARHYEHTSEPMQKGLQKAYFNWRQKLENTKLKDFNRLYGVPLEKVIRFSPELKDLTLAQYMKVATKESRETMYYRLSFREFLAQQMQKKAAHKPRGQKFFSKVRTSLRKFHKKFKETYAPEENFENWLTGLQMDAEVQILEKKIEDMSPLNFNSGDVPALQKQAALDDQKDYENVWGVGSTIQMFSEGKNLFTRAPEVQQELREMDAIRVDFSKAKGVALTLLQIADRNQDVPGLVKTSPGGHPAYVQLVHSWQMDQHRKELEIDNTMKEWRQLMGSDHEANQVFTEFAQLVDHISFVEGRLVSQEEIAQLAKNAKLPPEFLEFYNRIQDEFKARMVELQEVLEDQARRKMTDGTAEGEVALEQRLTELSKTFTQIRKRNYWPASRFGQYTVEIRATADQTLDGRKIRDGEVILFETWAKESQAKARAVALQGRFSNAGEVQLGRMTKHQQDYMGMPEPLLKAIKEIVPEEQWGELNKAIVQNIPGQAFAKRLLGKKDVKGASTDGLRSYMTWSLSFSRHVARIKYADQMDAAIDRVNKFGKQRVNKASVDLLVEYMREHKRYIMDPPNELNWLAALSFNFYLAFVPAKVFLNITQLPLVVMPHLSKQYGSFASIKAIENAQTKLTQLKKNPTEADPRFAAAIQEAVAAGVIDQSYAYEIATVGTSSSLEQAVPGDQAVDKLRVSMQWVGKWGALLWNQAEVWLRRTTFTAAWHLEVDKQKKAGGEVDYDAATARAISSVQRSVFEYRQWNRPKFMRGKLKPFFIFYTHIQHMIEHIAGPHPEKWRTVAMLIATSGLMGLPGADDLEELLTFISRKVNKMVGYEYLPHDMEQWARENISALTQQMTGDPDTMLTDLFMYGGSSQSMMLPELLQMTRSMGFDWSGAEALQNALPKTDIQPSLSLGRISPIPLEALNAKDFDSFVQKVATGAGGAGFGIPIGMAKAMFSTNQTAMARWFNLAPQFIRNPVEALSYYENEEMVDARGNRLARFDKENKAHWGEISAKALGFPLTRGQVQKRKNWAFFESKMYYQSRRTAFGKAMFEAVESWDSKRMVPRLIQQIVKWNEGVPPGQQIDAKALQRSVEQRIKHGVLTEYELPGSVKDVPLKQSIDATFPTQELPLRESPEDQKVILSEDLPTQRR